MYLKLVLRSPKLLLLLSIVKLSPSKVRSIPSTSPAKGTQPKYRLLNIFYWWDLCLVNVHRVFNNGIRTIKHIPSSSTTAIQSPESHNVLFRSPQSLHYYQKPMLIWLSPLPLPTTIRPVAGHLTQNTLSKTSDGSDPVFPPLPCIRPSD